MKKIIKIIAIILILSVIFVTVIYFNSEGTVSELRERMSLVHNRGKVTVSYNGEEIDLDEMTMEYHYGRIGSEPNGTVKMKGSSFKQIKGRDYGPRIYSLTIPKEKLGIDFDVVIHFGTFAYNNWQVSEYDVNIELNKADDGIECKGKAEINEAYTDEFSALLTAENNIVRLFEGI